MLDLGADLRHTENDIIILWFFKCIEHMLCDLVAEIIINKQVPLGDEVKEAVLPLLEMLNSSTSLRGRQVVHL